MTVCSNWVSPFTASLQKTRARKKPSPRNTAVAGVLLSYLTALALAQLPGSFWIIPGTPPAEGGHWPNSPVLPLGCSHLGLMSLIRAAMNHNFSPPAPPSLLLLLWQNQRPLAAQGAGEMCAQCSLTTCLHSHPLTPPWPPCCVQIARLGPASGPLLCPLQHFRWLPRLTSVSCCMSRCQQGFT